MSLAAQVGDSRHVTGGTDKDEVRRIVTQRVAVVGVEVRREGAAALIAEEVVLSLELDAFNLASLVTHVKDMGHHAAEQTLTLDLRYHHVAVLVAVQCQLTGHVVGQRVIDQTVLLAEVLANEVVLSLITQFGNLGEPENNFA